LWFVKATLRNLKFLKVAFTAFRGPEAVTVLTAATLGRTGRGRAD
jgi:hypothetical protein